MIIGWSLIILDNPCQGFLSQTEGSLHPQEEEQDGDLGGLESGADLDETDVSFNIIGQVLDHP